MLSFKHNKAREYQSNDHFSQDRHLTWDLHYKEFVGIMMPVLHKTYRSLVIIEGADVISAATKNKT